MASRFLIRLHLRKRNHNCALQSHRYRHQQGLSPRRRRSRFFGVDDAFLLFGLACGIATTALTLHNIGLLYSVGLVGLGMHSDVNATTSSSPTPAVPSDHVAAVAAAAAAAKIVHFHKCLVVGGLLVWFALCSVKFSFLFFFRQLIRRQPGRIGAWWWAVFVFTVGATLFTATLNPLVCPYYNDFTKLGKKKCCACPVYSSGFFFFPIITSPWLRGFR